MRRLCFALTLIMAMPALALPLAAGIALLSAPAVLIAGIAGAFSSRHR